MVAFFLLVGVVAAMVLLVGDWVLARTSARELVETQMAQTAVQAGGGVPFFGQSGRSYLQQAASQLEAAGGSVPVTAEGLRRILTAVPFFQSTAVFDGSGSMVAVASLTEQGPPEIGLEVEAALAAALAGVPQEVSQSSDTNPPSSQAVFLTPVFSADGTTVLGALVGWTDLATNPLLQPVATVIGDFPDGTAMLVAESGTILLHTDPQQVGATTTLAELIRGQAFAVSAPDGTTKLAYVYPIPGHPWTVVLTVPEAVVDRLAIPIAARLFAVMAFAGVVVVLLTYAVSRGLTRPLRQMTLAAESIARGNLDRPVPGIGEDEVGRLAAALERMRRGLKTRLNEMDLLLQATQRMAATFNLTEVLPPILLGVQDVTESDLVRVALTPREGEAGDLETFQAGFDPGGWTTLDAQLLALSRERGRFVLENPGRAKAVLDLRLLTEPLEGLLALPMRSEEDFVGALWIGYRRPHLFTSDETSLLTILAGQLGVSVANARLYQRAEQERSRLGATLEATPDAVLLLDPRGGIALANPASEMVLRVSPEQARGKPVEDVVAIPRLVEMLHGAGAASGEVGLPGGRVLFASVLEVESGGPHRGGRVCVLRDITHYKKLDMLKSRVRGDGQPRPAHAADADARLRHDAVDGRRAQRSAEGLRPQDPGQRRPDGAVGGQAARPGADRGRRRAEPGDGPAGGHPAGSRPDLSTAGGQQAGRPVARRPGYLGADRSRPDAAAPGGGQSGRQCHQVHAAAGASADQCRPDRRDAAVPRRGHRASASRRPTSRACSRSSTGPARRRRRASAGSGLGLAIVKSIAEQHGGRVTVESRLGSGSVFVLEVPVRQLAADTRPTPPSAEEGSPRLQPGASL